MTTLAILSDIHGNLPALEAVLHDMAQFEIDHIVVAGDVINWGPFSAQCVDFVARHGWSVIRGNNEFYLLDHDTDREPEAWKDRAQWPLLPWLRAQLAGRRHHQIASWPDALSLRFPDGPPIRVVHGSGRSAWESLFASESDTRNAELLANVEESYVIAGHTHLAMDHCVGRWQVFNPGSVGVPLDGAIEARYMLLRATGDGWTPAFRRVPIDPRPLIAEFERTRFVEQCGVIGRLVVEEFRTARMQVLPFLLWRDAQRPGTRLSAELLSDFTVAERWAHTPRPYRV
jgi:predicted phosphodiesterase